METFPENRELCRIDERELMDYNAMLKRWLDASGCDGSCHRPNLEAAVKELRLGSREYWDCFRSAVQIALESTEPPPRFDSIFELGLKPQLLDLIEERIIDGAERSRIKQRFYEKCKQIYEKAAYVRRITYHVHILLGQRVDLFSLCPSRKWTDLDEKWQLLLKNIDYRLLIIVQETLVKMVPESPPQLVDELRSRRELVPDEYSVDENGYQLTAAVREDYNRLLAKWAEVHAADGSRFRPFMHSENKNPKLVSSAAWKEYVAIVEASLTAIDDPPRFESFTKRFSRTELDALIEERVLDKPGQTKLKTLTRTKLDTLAESSSQIRRIRFMTSLLLGHSFEVLSFKSGQSVLELDRPWRLFLDRLDWHLNTILLRAFDVDQADVQLMTAGNVPATPSRIADCVATVDVLENEDDGDGEMGLVRSMERLTLHDDTAVQEQVTGYSTNQFFIFWTPQTNNNNSKTFISQKNCSSQITNDPKTFITQKRTDLFYTAMASHGATAIQKRNPMSASASFDDLKKRLIERPIGDKRGSMVDDEDDDAIKLARNADKWQRIRRPRSGSSDED